MKTCLLITLGVFVISSIAFGEATEVTPDTKSTAATSFSPENRLSLDEGDGGWYIVPNVGVNIPNDWSDSGIKASFATGLSLGIGLGKEYGSGSAIQFDVTYMENDVDRISGFGFSGDPGRLGISAEVEQLALMLSNIWTIETSDQQPYYIGAGIGTVRGKTKLNGAVAGTPVNLDSSEWEFAYQAIAGMTHQLSPSSNLSVEYRFLCTGGNVDVDNHIIGLSVTFDF